MRMRYHTFCKQLPVFLILLVLTLTLTIRVPACAANAPLLTDDADLLSDKEESKLLKKLDKISDKRDCDIVVLTAGDLNGMEAVEYVDDAIDSQGFGSGREFGTVALLIFVDQNDNTNREVRVATNETANAYFSDSDNDRVLDSIMGDLSAGDYAQACETYADACDSILGESLDTETGSKGVSPLWIFGDLGIGAVIAMILGTAQKSKLKTKKRKSGAAEYKADGGINFTVNKDTFLNTRVERRKIEHDEPSRESSHEAGTTHTTSSGSKHGGTGRKF